MTQWLFDRGLSPNASQLTDISASYLLEELGIADYMIYPSCNENSETYKPKDDLGWKLGNDAKS